MGGSRVIFLSSPAETFSLGVQCAQFALPNAVFALTGDLGAGKTAFVQGLAQGLHVAEEVQSPTFTYLHIYQGSYPLYHFDLYRMKGQSDFFGLGFDEYFDAGGVVAIEWADRLQGCLPSRTFLLHFAHAQDGRVVEISGF